VQLHFGVDRMLRPPFAPTDTDLYALRPLAELPGVVTLWPPDELPFALPAGSTWFFADSTALGRAPERTPLPELHVTGDEAGVLDFSSPRLLDITFERIRFGLTTSPGKPQAFRLTLFTANGYLACLFADHGPADATRGTIDARKLLAGDGTAIARYGLLGPAYLGEALPVPTTIDLSTDFPTLVEAGVMQGTTFVPQLRARRLVTFRFDRGKS
jgi:hypothetical protein